MTKIKESRISIRASEALKERLSKASITTGVDESTLVRQCVESLCDEIERKGSIVVPIKIKFENETTSSRYPSSTHHNLELNDRPEQKRKTA